MAELGHLDHFFAKKTLKDLYCESLGLFLATLMRKSRDGHLCWRPSQAPELPAAILSDGEEFLPDKPIVRQAGRYYLQRNWVYETHILQEIQRLRSISFPFESSFQEHPSLLPSQKKAIEKTAEQAFSIICGGPGTGKTYTARFLVKYLAELSPKRSRFKVAVAAPTGKAASHLQTVLKDVDVRIEASTLHRLLRISPGEGRLFCNRKIDADLVIVDEASMIDVPLLAQLLESIGNKTRLVLIGDPDQLPPIEAGSLFAEMAALFGHGLEQSMRVENRQLLSLAEAIKQGEFKDKSCLLNWAFDEALIQKLSASIEFSISWEAPDPGDCLKKLNQFRILGALRQGPFGIDALNRQLVEKMSLQTRPGQYWALPIMVTANMASRDLYNGSCGVLIGKSRGGIHFRDSVAYFPQEIPFKHLPPFEVAFCLSIHKSQGSEFEKVIALFPQGSEHFGREALYTAVTRAKKQVEIAAEIGVLDQMLSQRCCKTSGFSDRQKYV